MMLREAGEGASAQKVVLPTASERRLPPSPSPTSPPQQQGIAYEMSAGWRLGGNFEREDREDRQDAHAFEPSSLVVLVVLAFEKPPPRRQPQALAGPEGRISPSIKSMTAG